ncbi:hypothetical protein AJ87_14630 [Rhizobium yanglingense]|nr:hypothetical protein AJ87_14630 [Rhizobium yanglingense]
MADALVGQRLTFTHKPAAVFFLRRWNPEHRANSRLTSLISQQRSDQRLAVDLVGLRPAAPAGCCNRGWVDDKTLDPFRGIASKSEKPISFNNIERWVL